MGLEEDHDVEQHVVGHEQDRTGVVTTALDHIRCLHVAALPHHLVHQPHVGQGAV
jgi:hypothetical protein